MDIPRLVLLFAAFSLAARLVVIWTGWIEGNILADDAYYYFTIASNLAAGHGSTFDGLAPTNGYHPLWLWVLTPIFSAAHGSLWLPVKIAITLASLLDVATGLLLAGIAGRHAGRTGAVLTSLFWFFSPFTVLLGLRGMESSLAALLVVVFFWRLALAAERGALRTRDALGIGLAWGFASLARTDNLPTLGLALLVFAAFVASRREFLPTLRPLLLASCVALLVTGPWLAWNQATFGSIVQVSGLVKKHFAIVGTWTPRWQPAGAMIDTLTSAALGPITFPARFITLEEFGAPRQTLVCLVLLVSWPVLTWAFFRRGTSIPPRKSLNAVLAAILAYAVVHTMLFGVFWHAYMNWYALPFFALYAMALGLLTRNGRPRRPKLAVGILVAGLVFQAWLFVRFFALIGLGPARPEVQFTPRLSLLNQSYPGGVHVGGFNMGAFGYVATRFENVTVINLDGVVNNRAYEAARDGRYAKYIVDNVEVLAEDLRFGRPFYRPGEEQRLTRLYRKVAGRDLWVRQLPGE